MFASEANVGAVMGMSPYERALQDAGRLSDNVISTLQVGEEQTIDQVLRSKANENIVNHFVSTIPAAERATISEAKGAMKCKRQHFKHLCKVRRLVEEHYSRLPLLHLSYVPIHYELNQARE